MNTTDIVVIMRLFFEMKTCLSLTDKENLCKIVSITQEEFESLASKAEVYWTEYERSLLDDGQKLAEAFYNRYPNHKVVEEILEKIVTEYGMEHNWKA